MKVIFGFSIVLAIGIAASSFVVNKKEPVKKLNKAEKEKALGLLQANCFTCHIPDMGASRAAPPMFKVQQHYIEDGLKKKEFINQIVRFVKQPNEDKVKMPGAFRKFGLMPTMNFKEREVRLIAQYLYEVDMSTSYWDRTWEKFKKSQPKTEQTTINLETRAQKYANDTKAELAKNLIRAIADGGPAHAVEFCNLKALAITDSMASVAGVKIKRVSDKPRNPANLADVAEMGYIKVMENALLRSQKPQPKVVENEDQITAYYAIETNAMCLQCHGPGSEIQTETLTKIKALYPFDKATGYGVNQIRGLLVVEICK